MGQVFCEIIGIGEGNLSAEIKIELDNNMPYVVLW